jgi:hypothetical protein
VTVYPNFGIACRSSSGVPYSEVKPNFKNTTPCIVEIRGLEHYSPDTFDRDLRICNVCCNVRGTLTLLGLGKRCKHPRIFPPLVR